MRAVARMLVIAYVLFAIKPAIPLLTDGLAHAFWKNVHIAVVHQVNGKEHVHYELRKAAADAEKDKGGQKRAAADEEAWALPAAMAVIRAGHIFQQEKSLSGFYLRAHENAALAIVSPPPKAGQR